MLDLKIVNGSTVYQPVTEDGITWETERQGAPGKLTFKVIKDETLKIAEGNLVTLAVDGVNLFYGFIFTLKCSQDKEISITAYDQIRYLKNKDTYVYEGKRADEVVRALANQFKLQCGALENTGFVIAQKSEENQTLLDMIKNALDLTLQNAKQMFVLYDDFGKITLKNIANMQVPILIDSETAETFDYSSSIDSQTYNRIKLEHDNKKAGKREIYIAKNTANINAWGVLQYFDTIKDGENGKAKAEILLKLYNRKTKNLSVSNAFGDSRIRAGSFVVVKLDLGLESVNMWMLVEKCKHSFEEGYHTMNLTLRGGDFIA